MKKSILITLSFFLIQGIVHNLGHPVTPKLVTSLGIPSYMFGIFFAVMSTGLMLGAPIWGILGDRGNKRFYAFFGLIGYSIGQIGFAYVEQQAWMVFFRFLSGFSVAASVTLLTSSIVELSEPQHRAKYLAYSVAMTVLGGSIGYYLGGFLATNDWIMNLLHMTEIKHVFMIQALLNVGHATYILICFQEDPQKATHQEQRNVLSSLKVVTSIKKSLLFFLLALTFITMGVTNLGKYLDVYFNDLGYTPGDLGTFVMVTGFVSLATSIFIVPFVARFKKRLLLITILQVLNAAIIFYVFRANQFITVIYTVYMLYMVFRSIYQPLEQNYISEHVVNNRFGTIMGIRQSFYSLGMVIGPLVGGFLYAKSPLLLFDSSAITFLIGVCLLGMTYYFQKREEKNKGLAQG